MPTAARIAAVLLLPLISLPCSADEWRPWDASSSPSTRHRPHTQTQAPDPVDLSAPDDPAPAVPDWADPETARRDLEDASGFSPSSPVTPHTPPDPMDDWQAALDDALHDAGNSPLDPLFSLDFTDVPVEHILEVYAELAGRDFPFAGDITTLVSLHPTNQLNRGQALDTLESTLRRLSQPPDNP